MGTGMGAGMGGMGMDEESAMAAMLGFSGFDTTHGKEVEDNKNSAARGGATKLLKRRYRQYMNRVGGFNRELDPQKL
jgi:U4/U6.U5 tri-snRNP-associated protein 3